GFIFLTLSFVTIIMRKIKGKEAGRELILLTVLSLATIIWGSLSGTWFGSEAIALSSPFKYLVVEQISTFNPRSSETVKYFCFIIGTTQIILAHGWNFISQFREKPRIKAIAQLGWMAMVFGLFFLVLNLVLDPIAYPIPAFALYLIFGGLGLVVIFSGQEGKFFKGILKGFAGLFSTFLDTISAFADVISYIRLFAVGLATVEIAKSFNAMASDMGSSVVGFIGAILVLVVGHGINIMMGALSVIVHGVRLNMLEFSGHLGMEWTGISYTPFKERETEKVVSE
ncbi:MAG: V-type ATP synthase subunit I, partial [Spirochaetales bacterium]|nr:V-type ATP synthase subunit I [Spirochaetales bacterium]